VRRAVPALAALLALAAAPAAQAANDGADVPASPLDLASATLRQDGTSLVLSLQTRGDWASRVLTARPGRSLCLVIFQGPRRFVCASATGRGRPSLTSTRAGGTTAALSATIDRPDLRTFNARFSTSAVGLRPGRFSWVVTSTWIDSKRCAPGRPACGDRLPDRGSVAATLVPPAPTGCRARSPWSWSNGSRSRRVVALTFDDGPSLYTGRMLDILKRNGVHGTFFVIGQQVSGGAAVLRRALKEGNSLGNHTWNHANVSGGAGGQLSSTQAAIRRATGYTPCVFRPPYGATSSLLVGQARSVGMDTVLWDVDPRDWARPGSGAIYSNVVGNARPGSIILSHDGGGPREQTLSAYQSIIPTLKRRGYHFATLPELLGLTPTYG
jgi:peptidoglycan/xylan/chitin deacetylase (PgdA/CDA1 family)